MTDSSGAFTLAVAPSDSISISKEGAIITTSFKADNSQALFVVDKKFGWKRPAQPAFYIKNGGLWLLLFIVFAETGLMVGFLFTGRQLIICGRYLQYQINCYASHWQPGSDFINLIILWILVSACGITGQYGRLLFGKKAVRFFLPGETPLS